MPTPQFTRSKLANNQLPVNLTGGRAAGGRLSDKPTYIRSCSSHSSVDEGVGYCALLEIVWLGGAGKLPLGVAESNAIASGSGRHGMVAQFGPCPKLADDARSDRCPCCGDDL